MSAQRTVCLRRFRRHFLPPLEMAQRVDVGAAGGRGARLRDGLLKVTLPKTKAAADAAGEKIPIRS